MASVTFRRSGTFLVSREITVAGLWSFAIIALIGGLYGKVDGFALMLFFIVAVAVSLGVVAMHAYKTEGPKDASGA